MNALPLIVCALCVIAIAYRYYSAFIASVLPVWMLLCPRDYLSSYLKIGTIAFLIMGVIFVHPVLNMPALTPFVAGGAAPSFPARFTRSFSSRLRASQSAVFTH